MRHAICILLIFIAFYTNGQDEISGQLFSLNTEKKITLENKSEMPTVWIAGNGKHETFRINENGKFKISLSEIEYLGDTLNLNIFAYHLYDQPVDYADYEILNIPKENLEKIIKSIYLAKVYWRPSCGNDCFTINAKKTFKKKVIFIDTGEIKYTINRFPEKVKRLQLDAKYVTDLNTDLIK